MFKFSVVFLSMLLGVMLSQGQEDDGGLYFDGTDVALACTAGTPLGEKMILAFTACSGGDEEDMAEMRRGRGKNGCRGRKCKGEGKKPSCPSVDSILESIGMKMEEDMCVMAQLGWIDENGAPNNQTMTEDIMSLPEEVSAQLSEEAVEECTMDMMAQWAEDPKHARCADKYSEEDMSKLEEVGMMVASYKCFQDMFQQSCKSLVISQIYQMYSSKDSSVMERKVADRQFGAYGSCLQTCQGVNFASTTSCTFSCFFGSYTRTCNQVFPVLAALQ